MAVKVMIKALCFDMDGLIFDTETLRKEIFLFQNKKLKHPVDLSMREKWMSLKEDKVRESLRVNYPELDVDAYRDEYKRLVIEQFEKGNYAVKCGFDEIFAFAKSKGMKVALATGSNYRTIETLFSNKGYDYRSMFDFVVTNDEIKDSKPAPDIYLRCCEYFGIEPKEVVVLEDSLNGVNAGLNAGCQTIMVVDTVEPTDDIREKGAIICNSLFEAKEYVEKFLNS